MTWLYNLPNWILWIMTTFTLVIIISCILYLKDKNSRFVTLVNRIPGPKTVLFLGNFLPVLMVPKHDWFNCIRTILREFAHAPLQRIWVASRASVFINQAPAIECVLNSSKLIDKADQYKLIHSWLGLGLLTSTGEKWKSRRKLITPSFHFRILDDFFKVFSEQTQVLVSILENLKDGDYFDVYPYMTRCTLDVICETAMGKRLHAQSDGSSEYVKAVVALGEDTSYRSLVPWLAYDWIFNLTSRGRNHKASLKIVHGFTNKVIEERWAELKVSQDANKISTLSESVEECVGQKRRLAFLDMLLENFRDSKTLNIEDIREEVDTFMFEGHDTTASALTWILYNIGRFPEIQERLHQEVDDVFGHSGREVSKDDLPQLKYLELVIKESMRMFPPVPFYARKTTEEIELCGYTIPAGVELAFHVYNIHRNEKYFRDPERFDPDRFLPENCAKRHPFSYIPFSAGPRNCIGQKFAMMEIKATVCQILRKFKITSKHRIEEIKILSELVLRPDNGMWIKLESRNYATIRP